MTKRLGSAKKYGCVLPAVFSLFSTLVLAQISPQAGSQVTGFKEGGLYFKEDCVPPNVVIRGIELNISGSLEAIGLVPSGWVLRIANGDFQSTLEGHAASGAKSLTRKDIRNIRMQIMLAVTPNEIQQVGGWLTVVAADGKEKKLPLDMYNFDFVELYPRHRLQ